jgi:hypothetical protein
MKAMLGLSALGWAGPDHGAPGHRRWMATSGSHRTWRAAFPHHALRQLPYSVLPGLGIYDPPNVRRPEHDGRSALACRQTNRARSPVHKWRTAPQPCCAEGPGRRQSERQVGAFPFKSASSTQLTNFAAGEAAKESFEEWIEPMLQSIHRHLRFTSLAHHITRDRVQRNLSQVPKHSATGVGSRIPGTVGRRAERLGPLSSGTVSITTRATENYAIAWRSRTAIVGYCVD